MADRLHLNLNELLEYSIQSVLYKAQQNHFRPRVATARRAINTGSSNNAATGVASRLRQFGCSSMVPGRFGCSMSPNKSSSGYIASCDGVAATKASAASTGAAPGGGGYQVRASRCRRLPLQSRQPRARLSITRNAPLPAQLVRLPPHPDHPRAQAVARSRRAMRYRGRSTSLR